MGVIFNMKEKDYYSEFTKKINELKKAIEQDKKDIKMFEDNYKYIKEKERSENKNDNDR